MFELFEDVVEVTTRLMKLGACIAFAVYVAWKSNFIMPETYGDLAVPAVMALFLASLVLIAGALINPKEQEQQS